MTLDQETFGIIQQLVKQAADCGPAKKPAKKAMTVKQARQEGLRSKLAAVPAQVLFGVLKHASMVGGLAGAAKGPVGGVGQAMKSFGSKPLSPSTMGVLNKNPAIGASTSKNIAESAMKRGDKKTMAMFI